MDQQERIHIEVTVVVPFYNEEDVVAEFHAALMMALERLDRHCEAIYVDDGSRDATLARLRALADSSPVPITVLQFRRNYGQTAGLQAGFEHARGDVIVAMDGDLQHDPAQIPLLLEKIDDGFDLVSGWRERRVDSFILRRLPSLAANRLVAQLTGIPLHDFGTTFKAYRRTMLQEIHLYGDLHRFIPVLVAERGGRICEVPISNIVRDRGRSKYGLGRTTHVMVDILTLVFLLNFRTRPMHFLGIAGIASAGLGGAGLVAVLMLHLTTGADFRGTMGITVMLIILGIQLLATGLISEMVMRTYFETTGRKTYDLRSAHANPAATSLGPAARIPSTTSTVEPPGAVQEPPGPLAGG